MIIECPSGFELERTYVIKTLFSLIDKNIPVINFKGTKDWYVLILDNKAKIYIKDIFFGTLDGSIFNAKVPDPQQVLFLENEFCPEHNIPVIYGENFIKIGSSDIFTGLDIFGSAFFMLSRWEEVINRSRDRFARFPGVESLAYKAGFLARPVVNEYAEYLASMIRKLGGILETPNRSFRIIPTHDVDHIFFYPGRIKFLYRFLKGYYNIKDLYRFIIRYNPYWTFPRLMEISEKRGLQSRFYFLSSSFTRRDNPNNYDHPMVKKLFHDIIERGHVIGLHGSFDSSENYDLLKSEKEKIENAAGCEVRTGRQHYLRFSTITTWKIWDDLGMSEDQTCGYHDAEGFRCGTGDSFAVFDLLSRKQLSLIETPLLIMEGTLKDYRSMNREDAIAKAADIVAKCKKYRSPFTILYHNSSFYGETWKGWDEIYEEILDS